MALSLSSTLTELPWQAIEAYLPLLEGEEALLLDSGGDPAQTRQRFSFLCPKPKAVLKLTSEEIRDFRPYLRSFWQKYRPANPFMSSLPFTGGLVGFASYEAGLMCEGLVSRHKTDAPLFLLLACTDLFIFDRLEQRLWWASAEGNAPPPCPAPFASDSQNKLTLPSALNFIPDDKASSWKNKVEKIRAYIEAGDIFQANLTMRWKAERPANMPLLPLYTALRQACPAPFGAFLNTPDFGLLSASIERFLSLSAEGLIETRPIKGTAPIHADPLLNNKIQEALSKDEKELAENLMITDLMRNDLGRVSKIATVTVPQLCVVERFRHVHHLVSSVQGRLQDHYDVFDLLQATLPPGSVTGAPKHQALKIIDELESSSRGVYCGTLLRIGWDGALDSSVIIRSISATSDQFRLGAGGGITWPSDPGCEYDEMLLKAAPLLKALGSL
ncbi:anthranilate synthase component I family protein [Aristophania vespae]|uniref:Anthranilate synthase component I family protein n=1 Tax=Aristophania vespae TaxID=2697033 RepID=A0A6P1NHT9_9PROT|nr:anthranilate synthase component I family protein [Aristophania vespae]QHI96100.1 anthranilate synthase component I family protein [Aristophania vespae]